MNSIKFMIALMAVCALVMPAFSMQDNMGQDCGQKMCSCLKSPMEDDGKKICLELEDDQKPCGCQKPCDQKEPCDHKEPCGCVKSMMGQDDKQMPCGPEPMMEPEHKQIKSMMDHDEGPQMCQGHDEMREPCDVLEGCDCQKPCDDKEPCGCMKSMMGQDDKQMPCGPEPMMEPGHKQIKSMMGQDCNQMGHKHIKSMMGDRDGNEEVMMIVVVKR